MMAFSDDSSAYLREYVCHVDHFLSYVTDAIHSPDLADFEAILAKIDHIKSYTIIIEGMIGIQRKEKHEGRKNTPTSQTPSRKKEYGGDGPKTRRGQQEASRPTQRSKGRAPAARG